MPYRSSKTYGHEVGLSACFRQWRADSHCRFLHGYALSIHLEFECDDDALDIRNWCVDFGSLKSFKGQLEATFDHKTLVAADDPELETFRELDRKGLIQLVVTEHNGCEAFAKLVYEGAALWLKDAGYAPRVRMHSVTVREHAGNSATYFAPLNDPAGWAK